MLKENIKYGKDKKTFTIDKNLNYEVLKPKEIKTTQNESELINQALNNPIESKMIKDSFNKEDKISIVTSDITRPLPSYKILPHIIKRLKNIGIKEKNITIIFALGSHRKHSDLEKEKLVGKEIYNSNIILKDHDMEKCINLGKCKNNTPVDVLNKVVQSDRVICLGNIDYHYFAGYSGGMKAIMPGVSSWEAISENHSNMIKPEAQTGNLETNPVRQDIDEVLDFVNVDYIFNVVLDTNKHILKAFFGHPIKAHREGCKYLDSLYEVEIKKKFDIVIASPGGFPKDINLYQSQKSLDNAKHATKNYGIIILVAKLNDRFGEEKFKNWMLNKKPDEMIKDLEKKFQLGAHKAVAIAKIIKNKKIYLISDLDDKVVNKIGFLPFDNVQNALNKAIEESDENLSVAFIPSSGTTLPKLKI
ncbi:MAG: nickel-dependent lactate racemase [Bacillota bacterium]